MKKIKINIVDVSVVLVVIILIIASCIKFKTYNASAIGENEEKIIEYSMLIESVREYTTNMVEVGDVVFDSQTNTKVGKIIDKQVINATTYEKVESGEFIKVEIPDKYDVILLIETPGSVNDSGFFANKSVEIKVGSEKTVSNLFVETTGKITGVKQR